MLAQLIALVVEFAPEELQLITDIATLIKQARDGSITAQQAQDDATQRLGLMLGRMANIDAEAAGTNAAVDADAARKFPGGTTSGGV